MGHQTYLKSNTYFECSAFFFITEFVKADALFAVLVVEQHDDFIIINMNAVYENIDQPYRKNKRPAVWTGNDGANKEI